VSVVVARTRLWDRHQEPVPSFDWWVAADAGEGLDVRGAYVHGLDATRRGTISVSSVDLDAGEQAVTTTAARIRARDYTPNPGQRCRTCEVRTDCDTAQR